MKMKALFLMLLPVAGFSALAQPPPHERDGERPPPPVHRFFEHIKKSNPEEFERLRQLREEDPEAFREELARRLAEARRARDDFGGIQPGGKREPGGRPHLREEDATLLVDSPELDQLERESRERARSVREAGTAEAREAALASLKVTLEKSFDLRERLRAERLAKMETRLQKVRQMLDERQRKRDEIIERRARELTETEPLAW